MRPTTQPCTLDACINIYYIEWTNSTLYLVVCIHTYTHVLTCFLSEVVGLFACNCKTYVRNRLVPLQLWPFSAAAAASTFVVVTFLQLVSIFSQVTIMLLFKQEIQQQQQL